MEEYEPAQGNNLVELKLRFFPKVIVFSRPRFGLLFQGQAKYVKWQKLQTYKAAKAIYLN
jgi:hypothetical protein